MEASSTSGGRIGGKWPGHVFAGRRSGIYVAVIAALLAGVLLFAFVQHYRKSTPTIAPTTNSVVVATGFIPKGTPASRVATADGLQRELVKSGAAVPGAISDSSQISGEVATKDIYPGEQIVATDFSAGDITIAQYLPSGYRAIEIPIDSTHGLQGYVTPGDKVDLLTSEGGAKKAEATLATNLTVLSLGTGTNGAQNAEGTGSIVLSVPDSLANKLAYASDNSKLWVLLRPPVWSKPSKRGASTTSSTKGGTSSTTSADAGNGATSLASASGTSSKTGKK
jgi:pilus assembly protein CpaB